MTWQQAAYAAPYLCIRVSIEDGYTEVRGEKSAYRQWTCEQSALCGPLVNDLQLESLRNGWGGDGLRLESTGRRAVLFIILVDADRQRPGIDEEEEEEPNQDASRRVTSIYL